MSIACAWCKGTEYGARGPFQPGYVEVHWKGVWVRYHFDCEGLWAETQKTVNARQTMKGPVTTKAHRNNKPKRSR